MQLHTYSHRWERRVPDWPAAAVAGLAAGAILMVLELLWSIIVVGMDPWRISHMVAAIVMGQDALQVSDFNVSLIAAALVTHYVLGTIFGLVLAAIIAPFHLDSSAGMALLIGTVFGLVLYFLNFYGMVRFFPWFAEIRGWPTVAAHIIFGMAAAIIYRNLERKER